MSDVSQTSSFRDMPFTALCVLYSPPMRAKTRPRKSPFPWNSKQRKWLAIYTILKKLRTGFFNILLVGAYPQTPFMRRKRHRVFFTNPPMRIKTHVLLISLFLLIMVSLLLCFIWIFAIFLKVHSKGCLNVLGYPV